MIDHNKIIASHIKNNVDDEILVREGDQVPLDHDVDKEIQEPTEVSIFNQPKESTIKPKLQKHSKNPPCCMKISSLKMLKRLIAWCFYGSR